MLEVFERPAEFFTSEKKSPVWITSMTEIVVAFPAAFF